MPARKHPVQGRSRNERALAFAKVEGIGAGPRFDQTGEDIATHRAEVLLASHGAGL